jgi:hypothetical protein
MAEMKQSRFDGTAMILIGAVLAMTGFGACAAGLLVAKVETFYGYLTAFVYVTTIALGALIFLQIAYITNARWPTVVRRLLEAVAGLFPLLAVLFVPLAFGLEWVYPWATPQPTAPEHVQHLLEHKEPYLDSAFFVMRTAMYFAVWIIVAELLRGWSLRGDRDPDRISAGHGRERAFAAATLPLVALALTFAAFDWLMSLQPTWYSSIFGIYVFAGGFVASFAVLAMLAAAARRTEIGREHIRPPHFHAIGRMLFGLTIFWAYNAFFQAMLIQIANKPEEVEFYVVRLEHGWDAVVWLLLFAQFVVPFALLLLRSIKHRPRIMAGIGAWIAAAHYLDVYWLVAPTLPGHGPVPTFWDAAALAAVGGTAVAFAGVRLRGRALVPLNDPWLEESRGYRSPT